MNKIARNATLGFLFVLAIFLVLTIQSQAGPVPPYPVAVPVFELEALPVLQIEEAPVGARSSGSVQGFKPLAVDACSGAHPTSCNTVVEWENVDSQQWVTYSCLDTNIFSPTLTFSEALYYVTPDRVNQDLAVALPFGTEDMEMFGAIMNTCNNLDCEAASHVENPPGPVEGIIHQHAIVPDAPVHNYDIAIDSPNMTGKGDAIISCGDHRTGWCDKSGVVSTTLTCGNYSFKDNLNNGRDEITHYGINLAFDGPEVTYKVVLTESKYVSFTLHYTGNTVMKYYNYMGFFLLSSECNQRQKLLWGAQGESPMGVSNSAGRWLPPGTYYLVVDGIHMPTSGDDYGIDVGCTSLEAEKIATDVNGPPLYPDDTIKYTVLLHNMGGLDLYSVGVADSIPAHTTYVIGSAQTTPAAAVTGPDPLVAVWSTLGAGETSTLTFGVTVDNSGIGKQISNSADVSTPDLPDLGTGTAVIGPVRPPIAIEKTVTGGDKEEVEEGDTITYTITITNLDNVAVNGFTISDTLSPYVTYVVGSATPAPTQVATEGPVWSAQSIGPNGSRSYVFNATVGVVPEGKAIENTVWLKQPGRALIKTSVTGPGKGPSFVYLPIVLKNY